MKAQCIICDALMRADAPLRACDTCLPVILKVATEVTAHAIVHARLEFAERRRQEALEAVPSKPLIEVVPS